MSAGVLWVLRTVANPCLCASHRTAGSDKLLGAEAATLDAGGNVLRLVGLYHAARGPHTFFIKMGEVARYGGYVVNMLHYEDAARIAMAVLTGQGSEGGAGFRGQVFVGADGHPLTFQEMVDACFASGLFSGSVKFTGGRQQEVGCWCECWYEVGVMSFIGLRCLGLFSVKLTCQR
jgi:hypothetical protein